MNAINLITYDELLKKLRNSKDNHLLLGNGFNNSLGIATNYKNIFAQMKDNYSGYEKIESYLQKENYDIERLIEYMKNHIQDENEFLEQYIENKVKLDFMKATNEIVQNSIKHVYQTNNIHLFFKNFTNYFTLNYDPFLYLLLLKFKKSFPPKAIALQNSTLFIKEDLDSRQEEIYTKIKQARDEGKLDITVGDIFTSNDLKRTKKTEFISVVKRVYPAEKWKNDDIQDVVNRILREEQAQPNEQISLDMFDSFLSEIFHHNAKQNLFFLHGAFHIFAKKNGNLICKITQTQTKAFHEKLEDTIHSEDKEIVCVLTNNSEAKQENIDQNNYLDKCFRQLGNISGSLVILGSSLAENDKHIFNQINRSSIEHIYLSSCEKDKQRDYKKAGRTFNNCSVTLFDYETISYDTT